MSLADRNTPSILNGGFNDRKRLSVLISAVAIGICIYILCAQLQGTLFENLPWILGTHAASIALLLLGYNLRSPRAIALGGACTALILCAIAAVQIIMNTLAFRAGWPVDGGLGNPNLLSATLAISCTIALALGPRKGWTSALVMMVLGASILLQSVTATVATTLAAVGSISAFGKPWAKRLGAALATATILLGSALLYATVSINHLHERNLLTESSNFSHPSWNKLADFQVLQSQPSLSPLPGIAATHIVATTRLNDDYPTLLLTQGVERSNVDSSYVASIFLMGYMGGKIVLSSNISSVECQLSESWTRCVTPARPGDGQLWAQLQLRTEKPGVQVDFFAAGAQLERGLVSTEPHNTSMPAHMYLLQRLLYPYSAATSRWTIVTGLRWRLDHYRVAWKAFLSSPIIGLGSGAFGYYNEAYKAAFVDSFVNHAHNQFLNVLVDFGALGLLALLVPLTTAVLLARRSWRKEWFVILLALILLQTGDTTYYFAGVFYPIWIVSGMTLRSGLP